MRVTAETRSATRDRILDAARELFAAQGFEATTTRDLARVAEIAAGTLFNYFPSKEVIATCLAADALAESYRGFERGTGKHESFEEKLFALIAAGLRRLKPFRTYLPVVLETMVSPASCSGDGEGQRLRVAHLEMVSRLAVQFGYEPLPAVTLQIYWSLYTGLLAFWATDDSPRQEDTLALLDHSMEMFVGWLGRRPTDSESRTEDN